MLPSWIRYFGDFRASSDFLDSKPYFSVWALPIFMDSVCRAFGQVVFANNPVSGLLVILALLIADPIVACSGLFAASVATIFSWWQGYPRSDISAGLTAYNAVLVGTVTTFIMAPGTLPPLMHFLFWAALFVGAVLSVYATSAMSNMLGSLQPSLPCLTLPFNMVACLLVTCLRARLTNGSRPSDFQDFPEAHLPGNFTVHVDFLQMLSGSVRSAGQVYAVNNMASSALIFLGMLLFSPTMTAMAFTGALLGTITGVMSLGKFGLEMAGSGVLGYNSLLSTAAVGGMFYVISWRCSCAAFFSAILSSFLVVTLLYPMQEVGLSVLTLPFVISTLVFLAASSEKDGIMARPQKISFPELHRLQLSRMAPP